MRYISASCVRRSIIASHYLVVACATHEQHVILLPVKVLKVRVNRNKVRLVVRTVVLQYLVKQLLRIPLLSLITAMINIL